MFEATKVEKSKRNKRTHRSSNKSRRACAELQTIICCCFSSDSANLLGTKKCIAQNFWKVYKSWRQKRCCRNHFVYILLK